MIQAAEISTCLALVPGSALLPDTDHESSTVSRTYGPVTQSFAVVVALVTGGHRHGTHSLAGVGMLAGLAWAGLEWRHTVAGVLLAWPMVLALAGVVRLLKIPGWFDDVAPIPLVGGVVFLTDIPLWYVPPALALGCLIHIVGDMLTDEGCPLLWPVLSYRFSFHLMTTDGRGERWILNPACWLGLAGCGYLIVKGYRA
jgi:membrane-bound metal-dependent hydrolase YbcI (DUF457 family)